MRLLFGRIFLMILFLLYSGDGHALTLSVREVQVDVVNRYARADFPYNAVPVEHESPLPPIDAIKTWAANTLQAGGGDYTARLGILEATLHRIDNEVDRSFLGWFKNDIDSHYDVNMDVVLEILDPRGRVVSSVHSLIAHRADIMENASLAEREAMMKRLVEQAIHDLDAEIHQGTRTHLGLFVK